MESMARLKGKKILVTGGAGFIGGHLVEELVVRGADVSVIDIKVHPQSTFSINKLNKKAKFKMVDITDKKKLSLFFRTYTPDYIYHLAAEPIVENAYENPHRTFETNIMGTVLLLEEVRKNKKIKGVIVASTDKAYGKTTSAYKEDSPLKGDHPYDVSKSSADLIAQAYFASYNLPILVTRFGNVYGEGDIYLNRIIPGICRTVINDEVLQIRSDGSYVRDYLYVKDVVDGYLLLLENIEKIKGHAFNFASKDSFSVLELIHEAEKILKKKIRYKILNVAKNEIPYQHLDDKKVRKLGWKNKYSLSTTLPSVLEWYKKL